ncbi:C4-dicarboxylate ABC transporter permease [Bosea caraganae]|uniref:C4-dicarboxylate ABC transporter permease n=1 Tax=Bosea caraganae TaxID=2763117 RepID=A0A370L2H8_9HYPH|nr:TRAP transporter large permease subunit [Bosea caraganae]RDJ21316.1 C4-dicarboxylate ABC transporter permease [Bosea caraganae]RDJ26456.1 C4-dicarboxylate ABC transporter permease [Bosea caraganae]
MAVHGGDDRHLAYDGFGQAGRGLRGLLHVMEAVAGLALAVDVAIVFASVIFRYFLHSPITWAEEIARALMVMLVFFGAGTVLGRSRHAGIDVIRGMMPAHWQPALIQLCCWIVAAVSAALLVTSFALMCETWHDTTALGLPHAMNTVPVVIGSFALTIFGLANALEGPRRLALGTLAAGLLVVLAVAGLKTAGLDIRPVWLLILGFLGSVVIGVPIAFALAFASLLYFLADPSLPMVIYAQQVAVGADHFVLLAIPFFVLAGIAMEKNGMSSRLIELLLRLMGRLRGGLNLIIILATALFSGISGSKLADIAAVGGIIMPAVRKTKQDPNDAAGLLACTAIMAETIPPCVNMIIFAFVANISIAGLFMAGIVPAIVLALALAIVAIWYGRKVDPSVAFDKSRSMLRLIGGAMVALVMVAMIGRGVTAGVATSTEVSAFAVVYALLVGGLAFRELSFATIRQLFVGSAAMAGGILFIVASASSFAYALTLEQIPSAMSHSLVSFGQVYGSLAFLAVATLLMIVFGAVLEGAPALIIFGPLLTPIAAQLGINPLHFGTIMVIAMGFGLFSPPVGLGLFATCAITETRFQDVVRPMMKYLAVLAVGIVVLALFPILSLWLPTQLGLN